MLPTTLFAGGLFVLAPARALCALELQAPAAIGPAEAPAWTFDLVPHFWLASIAGSLAIDGHDVGQVEGLRFDDLRQPGPVGADVFHPERAPRAEDSPPELPPPAYGGRVIVCTDAMPVTLCGSLDVAAATRRILFEVHETLLARDWEHHDWRPNLCMSFDVEDTLILTGGRQPNGMNVVYGKVTESPTNYTVTPISKANALKGELLLPKTAVQGLERGTVLTFRLKDGITWHDGHPFDAEDVRFSWSIFLNKFVHCDEKRFPYQKILAVEVVDRLTVRFQYERQYFNAIVSIGGMPLLPRHLYDLTDPDNQTADPDYHAKRHAADAPSKPSEEERAEYVNSNPHNKHWVGLGPYRIAEWGSDYVEARRYPDYFDPARGGYVDTIRWRAIPDTTAAMQALLAGEIDYYEMLTPDEYFGAVTDSKPFTDRYYKGWRSTSASWFVGWNLSRPKFQDERVRRAFARLFDFEEFRRTFHRGLAIHVTGSFAVASASYNREVVPYPHDAKEAAELLHEAGWVNKNAEGTLEKDGEPFVIDFYTQSGDSKAEKFSARFQESLAAVGVKLNVTQLNLTALTERKRKRDFDAIALDGSSPLESDPEQVWHSRWSGIEAAGSNYVGFTDKKADELIERGQRELDSAKRAAIWRELHARIYELQPCLFGIFAPRLFAMSKTIRGFQAIAIDPGYVLRRWHFTKGTPGTRPTPK